MRVVKIPWLNKIKFNNADHLMNTQANKQHLDISLFEGDM